jgi:hypothetical protein
MFTKAVVNDGHTRRFTIGAARTLGWELRVEEDGVVVEKVAYSDWHRVERALRSITERISKLEAGGWRETQTV